MPAGLGPVALRNVEANRAAVEDAATCERVDPGHWTAPAVYARGSWPKGDFAYVKDPRLRFALSRLQDWVRAIGHAPRKTGIAASGR